MDFRELATKRAFEIDGREEYLLVYHSGEGYNERIGRGEIYRRSLTGSFIRETAGDEIRLMWVDDRLVVTSHMKKVGRDPMRGKMSRCVSVKCLYPMVTDSPYYNEEDLFEAKLTGDYRALSEKIRKPFMKWKMEN